MVSNLRPTVKLRHLRNGFIEPLGGLVFPSHSRWATAGAPFGRLAALLLIVVVLEGMIASPADAGSGSTCNDYNPALFTKGNTFKIVEKNVFVGGPPYTSVDESKVMGLATFHGHKVIDVRHHIEIIYPGQKTSDIIDEFNGISKPFVYDYGDRDHSSGAEVYSDPPISFPTHYTVDVPYVSVSVDHTSSNGTDSTSTRHATSTFLGMESVTVPAGTFMTCKIKDESYSGDTKSGFLYNWIVSSGRYAGISIKSDAYSATGSSIGKVVALSLQLNGK